MGTLVNGKWSEDEVASALRNEKGEFVRAESVCREWVTTDGSSPFPAEAKRYHLLLAHNCPWAHRTQIARKLLELQHAIGISFAETQQRMRRTDPFRMGEIDKQEPISIKYLNISNTRGRFYTLKRGLDKGAHFARGKVGEQCRITLQGGCSSSGYGPDTLRQFIFKRSFGDG